MIIPQIHKPKFVDEFKQFAVRGNVLDLAVGVIIGASFGKVVSSIVSDVLMPPIAFATGGVDLSNKFAVLKGGQFATLAEAQTAGAITVNYGVFLNSIIDFAIVAFVIFMLMKTVNRVRREPPAPTPDTKECIFCFGIVKKAATRCPHCTSTISAQ